MDNLTDNEVHQCVRTMALEYIKNVEKDIIRLEKEVERLRYKNDILKNENDILHNQLNSHQVCVRNRGSIYDLSDRVIKYC